MFFSIARYIVEGREREKYKGHGSDALIQIVWDTLSYGKSMKTQSFRGKSSHKRAICHSHVSLPEGMPVRGGMTLYLICKVFY